MTPKERRALGRKIAGLVCEANKRFPDPGQGARRNRWVIREAAKTAPSGASPSEQFGRTLGLLFLRIGIEVACATLDLNGEGSNE